MKHSKIIKCLNLSLIPLAFLAFEFSWTFQVIMQSELIGTIPYLFLLASASVPLIKSVTQKRQYKVNLTSVNGMDLFVGSLVAFSALHIYIGFTTGTLPASLAAKAFFIQVVTCWVYYYISRYANESEIKAVLLVISISTAIISIEWIYETYSKFALLKIVDFQKLAYDYLYTRRGGNVSVKGINLSVQFRSIGLFDNYVTTGAMVALGAFGTMTLFPNANKIKKSVLYGIYLVVLGIGMATTALVSYMVALPFALNASNRKGSVFVETLRLIFIFSIFIFLIVIVSMQTEQGQQIIENSSRIISDQFAIMSNFDPNSTTPSYLSSCYKELINYANFLSEKPYAFVVGEGFEAPEFTMYQRGGDVGLFDFAATFGVPFTVLFFSVCIRLILKALKAAQSGYLDNSQKMSVLFGCMVIVYITISFIHYNILFIKSIYAIYFLALGLIRRYCYLADRKQNRGTIVT